MVFIKFDIYKKMVNFVNKIKYWIKGDWELGVMGLFVLYNNKISY